MPRFVAPPPGDRSPGAPVRGDAPTFSVIVAAYQAAATIADAVASALEQHPPPFEVIVCDDGSTDDIAGALAPVRERITLLRQDNRGEAAAKNTAARAATGEFVVVLDADDVFLPGRLAALGELAMERPDLDILTTDAYLDVDGRRLGRSYGPDHRFATDDQRRAILDRNFVFGLAAVRRERLLAIGGFDESLTHATDWHCWARLVLDGARVGLVDEPLAVYRLHRAAANANRAAMAAGRLQVLRMLQAHPSLDDRDRAFVERRIAAEERRVEWERLREDLARGVPVRPRAWRIARDAGQPAALRVRAALATVAPWLARRRLGRNAQRSWTTAGDRRVPAPPPG